MKPKGSKHMDVVVVGAGVIGVSIGVELARRGAKVTIVEAEWAGAGTSSTSYAWVNSNTKEPISYHALNRAGLEAHHRLATDIGGGDWLARHGHLEFATDDAHRQELLARVSRLREREYEVEALTVARARALIPDLLIPNDCDAIAFFPREAHCYPNLYLAYMLKQASMFGVAVMNRVTVKQLSEMGGRACVGLSDGTELAADQVVSAAGRWTSEVARLAGVAFHMAEFHEPGDVTVGYLAVTNPVPVSIPRILTSPWLNVRPEGGGRLLLQALDLDRTADPRVTPTIDTAVAKELVSRLQTVLKNSEGATIEQLFVGQRAMPADGFSAIGPARSAPWLYIVATHSGVTLAPLLGTGVAGEIFGDTEPLFADFRPDRLIGEAEFTAPSAPRKPGEQ